MARTRTWTAPAAEVERERTRQVARIDNNLNQIVRWANTYASAAEVVTHLVGIERAHDTGGDLRSIWESCEGQFKLPRDAGPILGP